MNSLKTFLPFAFALVWACREPSASSQPVSSSSAQQALAASAPAPPEAAGSERPNVLLISIDTLRPDALGWVGGANATPVIDRLAAEGFRFPAAVSPVPLTLPAHTSIFTGLHPIHHGVHDNNQRVPAAPATLAELLGARGYDTAAFVSGYPLQASFGLERGFAHYDDELPAGEGAWLERRAEDSVDAALAWLSNEAVEPWFLWLHLYDPHYPYEAPTSTGPGGRDAYHAEVRRVDGELGRLLSRTGESPRRLTVLTSDHGESLGEHGEGTHGFFIYDSTILVPLIFHWPGRVPSGQASRGGRLVDIVPTVAELLSLPLTDEPLDGVSLMPRIEGDPQAAAATFVEQPAFPESQQPLRSYGWAPLRAIRHQGWKLILAPRAELYDLNADPLESRNLIRQEAPRARQLLDQLEAFEAGASASAATLDDPQTLARLESLGYVGSTAPSPQRDPALLPDPKDRIGVREDLTEANELLRIGRHGPALAVFDKVLATEPENLFALTRSAEALLHLGDSRQASVRLETAIALSSDQPEIHALHAQALIAGRRLTEAKQAWLEVLRLRPEDARTWSNLGSTLGMAGDAAGAVEALERAVEFEPQSAERHSKLAFAAFALGRLDRAITALETAAELAGEGFRHAGALGLLLLRNGDEAAAQAWLARSTAGEPEFAEARLELAVLLARAGDEIGARRSLEEAIGARPELRAVAKTRPELSGWL